MSDEKKTEFFTNIQNKIGKKSIPMSDKAADKLFNLLNSQKITSASDILKGVNAKGDMLQYKRFYETEQLLFGGQDTEQEYEQEIEQEQEQEKEQEKEQEQEQPTMQDISMELSLDWESVYADDEGADEISAQSVSDGFIICLNNLGRVDIEYIAKITGESCKTVIEGLKGAIYQNPDTWDECYYKGWETSEEYLSGNLIRKLTSAKKANRRYNGYFEDNVSALKSVMPKSVNYSDIYVTLGTPWLPEVVIDQFIFHLFGYPRNGKYTNEEYLTKHDPVTGKWEIPCKSRYTGSYSELKVNSEYGTKKINALHLIEKALNMQTVKIIDEVRCSTNKSGKKKVINREETLLANEKTEKLINEFKSWVWTDLLRKHTLTDIFMQKYGSIKTRQYNGGFLTLPTLDSGVQLYPYQKNAVARILFSPNTLLAHDVGSGKTYIMIAAGMELKRIGISQKNMYVIPNNLLEQWEHIFYIMYPDARLLSIKPSDFTAAKRRSVLNDIKNNDYDAVLISSSCFDRISVSRKYRTELLKQRILRIEKIIDSGDKRKITKQLIAKQKALVNQYIKITVSDSEDDIYFDELGINTLFVDEAHNYKNVSIDTSIDYVMGINRSGSEKCESMLLKVQCVQRQNNGRGVVFATGTPITNSITDAYIMQKYLQPNELQFADLSSFEAWAGMFAEKTTGFEIDVDTSQYRLATRFSKFHNLTELSNMLSMCADFHNNRTGGQIPEFDGYNDCVIPKTGEFQTYLQTISSRADMVRKRCVPSTVDNMLKITTDGRKAALDLRLVSTKAQFSPVSKAAECAKNVFRIYRNTMQDKSTQLIFCDTSTPRRGFNMYSEMLCLLCGYGIKKEEIAFIHSADSDKKRSELFADVQAGRVRVLIGSTFKLGLGVNVQRRLIALHHLDVPWRPADMVQREGRILRPGNTNSRVYIYRYITEGSFDAYSWQLLESKQYFISQLLTATLDERSASDIDDMTLNYGEVKALAVGNPLIKKRVELANEFNRSIILQRKYIDTMDSLRQQLYELPEKIKKQTHLAESCTDDAQAYIKEKRTYTQKERAQLRERILSGLNSHILVGEEKLLFTYQGFDVVLPENMVAENPFVWLRRTGEYRVLMDFKQSVNLARIDAKLDALEEMSQNYRNGLESMVSKKSELENQLAKNEDYTDKIDMLKKELAKIDKKLGVDTDE